MARWTKWVLLLIVLAVGAYVLFVDRPRRQAAIALRKVIEELDQSDPDWRLEQIEAKRHPVPDAENGALAVLAAKRVLTAGYKAAGYDELSRVAPPVRLPDAVAKILRAELQAEEVAVIAARKLIDYPRGRFAVRYSAGMASTPTADESARTVGALLWMDACNAIHDFHTEEAWRSARALLNVGRSVGDEPLYSSFMCRTTLQWQTIECLERILAHGAVSDADLAGMQESLGVEVQRPAFLICLRGQRAGRHELLEILDRSPFPVVIAIDKLSSRPTREAKWSDYVAEASAREALHRSHAWFLRTHTEMLQIGAEPGFAKYQKLRDLVSNNDTPNIEHDYNLGRLLGASSIKMADRDQRAKTLLHCAIAGMAAERFRLKHERWPDSLEQLVVEKLLSDVPEDLFDGKPLRLRRAADGIVIYSIGADGNYQGDALDRLEDFGDRVRLEFRLWDPAHRRQPPLPPRKPAENRDRHDG